MDTPDVAPLIRATLAVTLATDTTIVTLNSVVWANALTGISPTAKLVAVDLAGVSGSEEIGRRSIGDLAEFACCETNDVERALAELNAILKIERNGDEVQAAFPTLPDEEEEVAYRQRQKAYKEQQRYHLYVISKGGKIKIGISRNLQQRLIALRTSFPIEIEVLFTASGPYRAIRRAEMDAHEGLKDCALSGEYFDVSPERALETIKSVVVRHGVKALNHSAGNK